MRHPPKILMKPLAAIMLAGMSLKKYSEEDKDLYDEAI